MSRLGRDACLVSRAINRDVLTTCGRTVVWLLILLPANAEAVRLPACKVKAAIVRLCELQSQDVRVCFAVMALRPVQQDLQDVLTRKPYR